MVGCVVHILLLAALMQAPVPSAPAPSAAALDNASAAANANSPRPRPVLILSANPEATEAARRRHFSGNVEISTLIDLNGIPQDVVVVHGVGMGLDEKAVDAVRQYRFKPALAADGTPISMRVHISVNFQIF